MIDVTHIRLVDGRDRRLLRAAAFARPCAVVDARAGRFRGMRRRRGKGGDQGSQGRGSRECNAKFAGRRKPGGGYTYFDFMQNRNFDIAGPNPTPEEQKRIDEQYTDYLDRERRSSIAAAFAAKQQQQQLQQASLRSETEKAPRASEAPSKPPAARERDQAAHEDRELRAAFVLLRLAAAFRRPQGPEEAVRLVLRARPSGAD